MLTECRDEEVEAPRLPSICLGASLGDHTPAEALSRATVLPSW
jgi:hypothetical protein